MIFWIILGLVIWALGVGLALALARAAAVADSIEQPSPSLRLVKEREDGEAA